MWWYCASFAVVFSVKGSSLLSVYGSIYDKCTEQKKWIKNRQIILLECTDSEQKIVMAHFKDISISALFKVKI